MEDAAELLPNESHATANVSLLAEVANCNFNCIMNLSYLPSTCKTYLYTSANQVLLYMKIEAVSLFLVSLGKKSLATFQHTVIWRSEKTL